MTVVPGPSLDYAAVRTGESEDALTISEDHTPLRHGEHGASFTLVLFLDEITHHVEWLYLHARYLQVMLSRSYSSCVSDLEAEVPAMRKYYNLPQLSSYSQRLQEPLGNSSREPSGDTQAPPEPLLGNRMESFGSDGGAFRPAADSSASFPFVHSTHGRGVSETTAHARGVNGNQRPASQNFANPTVNRECEAITKAFEPYHPHPRPIQDGPSLLDTRRNPPAPAAVSEHYRAPPWEVRKLRDLGGSNSAETAPIPAQEPASRLRDYDSLRAASDVALRRYVRDDDMALRRYVSDDDMALRRYVRDDDVALRQDISDDDVALRRYVSDDDMALRRYVSDDISDDDVALRRYLRDDDVALRRYVSDDDVGLRNNPDGDVSTRWPPGR